MMGRVSAVGAAVGFEVAVGFAVAVAVGAAVAVAVGAAVTVAVGAAVAVAVGAAVAVAVGAAVVVAVAASVAVAVAAEPDGPLGAGSALAQPASCSASAADARPTARSGAEPASAAPRLTEGAPQNGHAESVERTCRWHWVQGRRVRIGRVYAGRARRDSARERLVRAPGRPSSRVGAAPRLLSRAQVYPSLV